jgi:Fe-coproporphyrin III synthase
MLDDLADYGAPVILFSGGKPIIRHDLLELIGYAKGKGLRAVISTNGTLITKEMARKLKKFGLSYVGISLDRAKRTPMTASAVSRAHLMLPSKASAIDIKVGLHFTIYK